MADQTTTDENQKPPILVSACLAGLATAWDATASPCAMLPRLLAQGRAVAVCPEMLGGLPSPRPPCEIRGGDGRDVLAGRAAVVREDAGNVTAEFLRGAQAALECAREAGVRVAVLREGSPSCGLRRIRDGSFSGAKRPGPGVTAALLEAAGIRVVSHEDVAGGAVDPEQLAPPPKT